MRQRCVLLALVFLMVARAANAEGDDASKSDAPPKVDEDPGFFASLTVQHQATLSLLAIQGLKNTSHGFKPSRELRLTDKAKIISGRNSVVWNLRLDVSRSLLTKGPSSDEPIADQHISLPNGSVLDKNYALIVQEAYVQHLREHWMLQVGSQMFAWGSADSINPMSVFNPQDLRSGFLGDKETKIAPIPAVRLALLSDGQTLNFIYAPWRRASLLPGPTQNWYLAPDNLSFNVQLTPKKSVEDQGSYAIKYDRSIAEGDLSFLYYEGADYDIETVPKELLVINNQPLTVNLVQVVPDKTSYGASYSQTFGKWVLKAETLYTSNKLAIPDVDRNRIQDVRFPLELQKTSYLQATLGFNYFAPITQFFGLPLGDTVLTAEYYKAHYNKKGVIQPSLSDLIITNLRTTAMEDRLELGLTYGLSPTDQGRTWSGKLSFNGDTFRHNLIYAGFDGRQPAANKTGSIFYYWRNNDLVSYEIAYPL